tara:strand:- start:173 stop:289 length:117 start_codon:yes stop_codon:yes gene_type:complete
MKYGIRTYMIIKFLLFLILMGAWLSIIVGTLNYLQGTL